MLIGEIYHKHPKVLHKDNTVREAVAELLKDDINGAVVVDDQLHVHGIVSLQDIAGATVPDEFKANVNMALAMYRRGFFKEMCEEIADLPITKVMRKEFLKVTLETNIMAVTVDFLKNDLYIVPVIKDKQLIGVVTRTQIKLAIAEHMGLLKKKGDD